MRTNLEIAVALAYTISLSACVSAPNRDDANAFSLVQQGQISVGNVLIFNECLMDGFNASHFVLTNVNVRQQRRADGYRVEALTNATILVSADISEAGAVRLWESTAASLVNTAGEREAFSKCLARFKVAGE